MLGSWLHTLVCMIIESSGILKSLLTCTTCQDHSIFLTLHFEFIGHFLQMNPNKMDKTIPLSHVFIGTSITRALERFLTFKCLWMLKFHMNIEHTLLRKSFATMLACMGKNTIMPSKMIMHRRLIFRCKVAMITNKFSCTVLCIDENHFESVVLMHSMAAVEIFNFCGGRKQVGWFKVARTEASRLSNEQTTDSCSYARHWR